VKRLFALLTVVLVFALVLYAVTSKSNAPEVPGLLPTPSGFAVVTPSPSPSSEPNVPSSPTTSRPPTPSSTASSQAPTSSPSPTASPTATPTFAGPTPTFTQTPSPAPSPTTIVSPDGYTLALPASWVALPVTGGDITALLSLLGQAQPGVANLIKSYLDVTGAKVSLVGLDPAGTAAGGLPAGAIVLLQPNPLGLSLDFLGGVVGVALGRVPGLVGGVQKEKVQIASGEAIRFTFDVGASGASGAPVTGRLVQYLVVRGRQGYIITFTTSSDHIARDGPLFDAIIASLTFP
jgi:hypothetical protein